ncbi:hypothetical protein [Formosa sp. PL04]|uniref:hypothetical protein n=1 Tax=Formosa sp. PL04 TaxID=3081755 RepID=UPI0029823919|nr:hypothetical protein [Formosa sp. PL04]MDW5288481.1 hypothetical protein [Formosa sp. PL04]
MKTVLIPTDFSENSLQLIKNAVLHYPNETIKLVLASGYRMSINAFNQSSNSRPKLIKSLANKQFYKTLSGLILDHKNKISNVKIELYTGNTNDAFKDFLITNNIDESLIPNNNLSQFPNKKCFDLTGLIGDFSQKVERVAYQEEEQIQPTRYWFFNLRAQLSFK